MEQTLHELASQGFRYYDDVKKYGKRNPFSQQYNLNIGRGTEKIHLMLRCLTGITGKKINILTARVSIEFAEYYPAYFMAESGFGNVSELWRWYNAEL